MIKQYRKKPVIIQAMEFSRESWDELVSFTNDSATNLVVQEGQSATCIIPTLEGDMIATEGDYIIKGVSGEFYPCKPDIFERTYEEVIDSSVERISEIRNNINEQKKYLEQLKDTSKN